VYLGHFAFPDHQNRSEQRLSARAYLEIRLNCGTRAFAGGLGREVDHADCSVR